VSQEIREDLLGELEKVLESALALYQGTSSGSEVVEPDLVPKLLSLFPGRNLVHNLLPEARELGGRAFDLAGATTPHVARDFLATDPSNDLQRLVVCSVLVDMLDAVDNSKNRALAAEVARAVTENMSPDMGRFAGELLSKCAASGAALEALDAARSLALSDPASKLWAGRVAYYGQLYPDAIQCLEEVPDQLGCNDLLILGQSYLSMGNADTAIGVFRQALAKSASSLGTFDAHFGLGRVFAGLAKDGKRGAWTEAVKELEAACEAFKEVRSKFPEPEEEWCGREYECRKLLGYAKTMADWEAGTLATAKAALGAGDDILGWFHTDEAVFVCRGFEYEEGLAHGELPQLIEMLGCAGTLADIVSKASDELDKQLSRIADLTERMDAKDREMIHLQKFKREMETGWRPYSDKLLRQYPGLPQEAAESLGFAQFLWEKLRMVCFPESIGHSVGRAVEIVVQQGLLSRMLEYARSSPPGQQFLGFDCRDPKLGIGLAPSGTETLVDRMGLSAAAALAKHSESVRSYIESNYDGEIRGWLLQSASADLLRIQALRNTADHTGEVREWQAPDILDFVLRDGFLRRLWKAGKFAERAD
jgi:tetratricopeptide (TPR) repeat protein